MSYSALPTTENDEKTDQSRSNSFKSFGALIVVGLCVGSVAVYASLNEVAPVSAVNLSYASTCLLGTTGPVMSGYDLVAYFSLDAEADGIQGTSDYSSTYGTDADNAYTFYFSSATNKALFDADPTAYLPQYGGFCSWGIAEETWWTKDSLGPFGNPNVWKIIDGELYFFMFDEPMSKFMGELTNDDASESGDTSKYISDGDARWANWFGSSAALNTGCYYWIKDTDAAGSQK